MRIISLWQPWASLIALELKQYETRSWGTDYRGKLLIHATKSQPVCITGQLEQIWEQSGFDPAFRRAFKNDDRGFRLPLPQGCVVAVVDLTDCLKMANRCTPAKGLIDIDFEVSELESACGDWQSDRFAWKLENVQPLFSPIPWKGAQGLRNAPLDLVELVNQQLKETA